MQRQLLTRRNQFLVVLLDLQAQYLVLAQGHPDPLGRDQQHDNEQGGGNTECRAHRGTFGELVPD